MATLGYYGALVDTFTADWQDAGPYVIYDITDPLAPRVMRWQAVTLGMLRVCLANYAMFAHTYRIESLDRKTLHTITF